MAELTRRSTPRLTLQDQLAHHPLAAFVGLAYGISWVAWLLSERIDLGVVNGFGILFTTGPALAAMFIASILGPEPSGLPMARRWPLFGLIGVLALGLMAVRRLWITPAWLAATGPVNSATAYPSFLALLMDVVAAAVVALVLSGVYSSRQGVHRLLRSLDPRGQPVRWYWWVIAVGLYPVAIGVGNLVAAGLGTPAPASAATGAWHWRALDAVLTFLVFVFHGGGLEEPGWRGFALPWLQQRFSPLRSSLILSVIWAVWHLPFYWFGGLPGGLLGVSVALALYWLLEVAPLAILLTAVFNRTGGSLLIAMGLHVSINVTYVFWPASALVTSYGVPLLGLMLALWMWRHPKSFHISPPGDEPSGGVR
jgi:membrane protease YdiL (CAAX protease family)